MSKIGDLWVRLGLKKEEFDQGMRDAKTTTEGFGGTLSKLKSTAVAVWAAIGVAVMKVASDFVQHSQLIGDQWAQTMAGMKAAWSNFLTALTNWDWNNFTNKIRNAFDAAKVSAASHDAAFEVENSIAIRKGQMQEELAQLQIISRDTRRSYAERAKAVEDYLAKVGPLYDAEIALRERIRTDDLNEYLQNAGLGKSQANRDALETFLTDIAPNGQLVEALRQYTKKNQGKKYKLTADDEKAIDQLFDSMGDREGSVMAVLATYYQGTNDATAKKAVDAITNLYAARAALDEETRRLQTTRNSAEAQMMKGDTGGPATAVTAATDATMEVIREANETYKALQEEEAALAELEQRMVDDILAKNGVLSNPVDPLIAEVAGIAEARLQQTEDAVHRTEELMAELQAEAEERGQAFLDAVLSGFSAGCQELTDQLFGLTDINAGAVLQALLSPLADLAIREGEILMAQGAGIEAVKRGLETLNGGIAIAAGAALIAIGAAAKSGLAALANRGGGAAGSTSTAAAAATSSGSGYAGSVEDMNLTITIDGQLSGTDILLAAERSRIALGR